MIYLKKLFFAPFFILSFIFLLYQFKPILGSTDFIFSISLSTFYNLLGISALLILSSFLFVLFSVIAVDWILILPVIILACTSSFLVLGINITIAFFVFSFMSFLVIFLSLLMELKNYIDFRPAAIFSSPVKRTCTLLIFAFAVTYFLSITPVIQKDGFLIPDSLIDAAMKFTPIPEQSTPDSTQTDSEFNMSNMQITQEQLDMLKQNPALLKQYNIDPKMLDNIGGTKTTGKKSQTVSDLTGNFVKKTLQDQFNNMLKPYLSFIPIVLSVALFLTLQSLVSLLGMLIPPLFWFIFLILGKIGFVTFTEEMRPVKKMVV